MRSEYGGLTVPPEGLVGDVPEHAVLPDLPEVEVNTRLDSWIPSLDPLVPVVHGSVQLLRAYWRAGWTRSVPIAVLRFPVADRLYEIAEGLPEGFGLAVFDAWRPLELQAEIYDAISTDSELAPGYFALPRTDSFDPPPHSTGGAVDLTLTFEGAALALGSEFDEFSPVSHLLAYEDRPGLVRSLRRMLFWRMQEHGFEGIRTEWWHFEYGTVRWANRRGVPPIYARVDSEP